MPTQEPTTNPAGTTPATAKDVDVPNVPLPRKPRPLTYRIHPADRPRLDAFRVDPKQSQAENLHGVIDLLENASTAIREQEQTQARLQEVTARAEQVAAERDQARQETQEAVGRLQAQEGELQRLQQALEAAQAQAAAAPAPAARGRGMPVALALLARELLDLATGGQCQGDVQARLIALASQALGAGGPPASQAPSHLEKRQDATAGSPSKATATAATATGGQSGQAGQAGQRKAARPVGDPARFGPLFEAGVVQAPAREADAARQKVTYDGQAPKTKTPADTQAEPVEPPADGGAGGEGSQPEGTTEQPADAAQKPPGVAEGTEVNKGPVVPRVFTRRGGAAEKLEKALQAVLAHNEAQTGREKKWAVTESALARLTGCFRPAIRTFFAGKAAEIEGHNQKHHLSGGHNAARGKKGETIEGEVLWRGALENGMEEIREVQEGTVE